MYTAKAAGKNGYAVFEPTMHAAIVERHALASELSKSVGRGELLVYYQPIVALASEATVRRRGARPLAPPDPRDPPPGRVHPPGRGERDDPRPRALGARGELPRGRRLASRSRAGPGRPARSTCRPLQLQQQSFVDDVQAILAETGFPASDLVLELTETAMFHDTHTTIARLEALRALGIRIAIDDFGTGYSSLGYLRRFPVDILKIAREFIGTEDSRSDDWAFARAIIALGQTLDLRVVAEGIETADQLKALRELGCELGQGYLFGRPADGPTIARHLWAPATGAAGDRIAAGPAPGRPAGRLRSGPMFILYAIVAGLVVGRAAGGRPGGPRRHPLPLGAAHRRWASSPRSSSSRTPSRRASATSGPPSTWPRPSWSSPRSSATSTCRASGSWSSGAICNMAAIVSNGGYMPATPEALASLGKTAPTIYSNSAVVASPNLPWLTDRFALPRWLPFANVFSVGDVLLAAGVFVLLVVVMRRGRRAAGAHRPDERRAGLKPAVTAPDPTRRPGAARQLPHLPRVTRTFVPCSAGDEPPMVGREAQVLLHRLTVQGKPVARRGRKARDLPPEDRPVAGKR